MYVIGAVERWSAVGFRCVQLLVGGDSGGGWSRVVGLG